MSLHPSFAIPAQLQAAQRYLAADAEENRARQAQKTATLTATDTAASAVLAVLREATGPLLATEIKARMPEGERSFGIGPTLLRLMLRGDIQRQGREGKYRYTSN